MTRVSTIATVEDTMKRVFVVTALIIFVVGLAACSSAPKAQAPSSPPPPPPPDYRKAAIELRLKADPKLNLYRATPHTVVACIYELRDPNGFNQLIDDQDGLPKLLECGKFDGSVTFVKKLVVQPGQELNEVLDQAEGAKYLGLVAGYFAPGKEKPYRLYRIPMAAGGMPASMKVDLYLGPQTIQDTGAK
jgi:type VI secretion system VasD/TssJ family lipoprotein